MSLVGQAESVRLPARNRHDLLVQESRDDLRVGLVGFLVAVLGQVADIFEPKLAKSGLSPSVDVPVL